MEGGSRVVGGGGRVARVGEGGGGGRVARVGGGGGREGGGGVGRGVVGACRTNGKAGAPL